MKHSASMALACVFSAFLLVGCLGYGKIVPPSGSDPSISLEELTGHWEAYHVYYATWPGDYPMSMVFDPKSDRNTLLCEDWIPVPDRQRLFIVVKKIQTRYDPRVYRIFGPDGQFFGYLYSPRSDLYLRTVDPNTLRVFPVQMSPSPGP